MKTRIQKLLVGAALVGAATLVQAQFAYTDNGNGTCTITGYTGPGGAVSIPNSINGLIVVSIGNSALRDNNLTGVTMPASVTNIGVFAFYDCSSLTNVTIGSGVSSIGDGAFSFCTGLTAFTVDPANSFYGSVDGVLFDRNQSTLVECPGGKTGIYMIPASITSITSIGNRAFQGCLNLTGVTIPDSVIGIGDYAFVNCTKLVSVTIGKGVIFIRREAFAACPSLRAAYFLGNPPSDPVDPGDVFGGDDDIIIYYLPNTGWGPLSVCVNPFSSCVRSELWNPQASALGVIGGHFGFNITGPSNTVIVVEACSNLAHPVWLPVSTNALDGSGASSFSDSQSGNYPARFYRFRSP